MERGDQMQCMQGRRVKSANVGSCEFRPHSVRSLGYIQAGFHGQVNMHVWCSGARTQKSLTYRRVTSYRCCSSLQSIWMVGDLFIYRRLSSLDRWLSSNSIPGLWFCDAGFVSLLVPQVIEKELVKTSPLYSWISHLLSKNYVHYYRRNVPI